MMISGGVSAMLVPVQHHVGAETDDLGLQPFNLFQGLREREDWRQTTGIVPRPLLVAAHSNASSATRRRSISSSAFSSSASSTGPMKDICLLLSAVGTSTKTAQSPVDCGMIS